MLTGEEIQKLNLSKSEVEEYQYYTYDTVVTVKQIKSLTAEQLESLTEIFKTFAGIKKIDLDETARILRSLGFAPYNDNGWGFGNEYWWAAAIFDEANRRNPSTIPYWMYEAID
jgi:hypothetical protein